MNFRTKSSHHATGQSRAYIYTGASNSAHLITFNRIHTTNTLRAEGCNKKQRMAGFAFEQAAAWPTSMNSESAGRWRRAEGLQRSNPASAHRGNIVVGAAWIRSSRFAMRRFGQRAHVDATMLNAKLKWRGVCAGQLRSASLARCLSVVALSRARWTVSATT